MSELNITVTGPQRSGKTALLKLLATGLGHLGIVARYQNDDGIERAKVTVEHPEQLANFTAFDTDLKEEPWREHHRSPDAKLQEIVEQAIADALRPYGPNLPTGPNIHQWIARRCAVEAAHAAEQFLK